MEVDDTVQETEKKTLSVSSPNSCLCEHLSKHLARHMKPYKRWSQGA